MEEGNENHSDRLVKMLGEVGEKVEAMRLQAQTIQNDREKILELLQDMQDAANQRKMSEVEIEDIETTIERLILRCLTIEISVSTPRNEMQEDAYHSVTELIEELHQHFQENPEKHAKRVEGYLNACLPEPLGSNIDTRFQSKVLGCTIDDQKRFRKKLHSMHRLAQKHLSDKEGNVNSKKHPENRNRNSSNTEDTQVASSSQGNGLQEDVRNGEKENSSERNEDPKENS